MAEDRQRTNILKHYEKKTLAYLVRQIPSRIPSDALTVIGLMGGVIVAVSFVLAAYVSKYFLILGVLGFFINWLGDSLDGRLAYYRNKPRKWYGFSLDFCTDWITIVFIGAGYIVYVENHWELWGFVFVILYGWLMMIALLRYKIADVYTIDSGLFGPTEARVVISFILVFEVLVQGSIVYSAIVVCVILFIFNVADFVKLLRTADRKDKNEQAKKITEHSNV